MDFRGFFYIFFVDLDSEEEPESVTNPSLTMVVCCDCYSCYNQTLHLAFSHLVSPHAFIQIFLHRMAPLGSTRALAVVSVTVMLLQLSSSPATLRVVSVPVSLESTGPAANSVLLDTGTMDLMDAGVSYCIIY